MICFGFCAGATRKKPVIVPEHNGDGGSHNNDTERTPDAPERVSDRPDNDHPDDDEPISDITPNQPVARRRTKLPSVQQSVTTARSSNPQEVPERTPDAPERVNDRPDDDHHVDDVPTTDITPTRPAARRSTRLHTVQQFDTTAKSSNPNQGDVRVQRTVNEKGGTHTLEDTRAVTDDALPTIHTRTSPAIFVKAVSGLSEDQRRAVRDMGFGSLLDLTITATPAKMGYWLIDNFNHIDRKLQLYDGGKIHVKEDDAYRVMGLPRGNIEVTNRKKKTESEALKEWADVYNVNIATKITATKVLDMIQICDRSDDWFKRHFLVLMITCLFESSQNGVANLRTVHLLDDLSNVSKMNWCAYMIRCLVGAKKSWYVSQKRKNFTGPLLFLTLFYVDKVMLSIRSVPRSLPIFKSWNNGLLKARERDEVAAGAFGRGYVDDDIHGSDGHHRADIHSGSPVGNDMN
ncbi:Unknown protein, partial [Striga hermonthica]